MATRNTTAPGNIITTNTTDITRNIIRRTMGIKDITTTVTNILNHITHTTAINTLITKTITTTRITIHIIRDTPTDRTSITTKGI